MEVRLLGPLTITGDASTPSSPQERAVLVTLAWHVPHPVSQDLLRRTVWGEVEPPSGPKALQVVVSRLRRRLPPRLLVHGPGGYALTLERDAVDGHRFVRLAASGRDHLAVGDLDAAIADLGSALGSWRGEPLQDVDAEWARFEVARLDEVRRVAVEDLLEARLARDPLPVVAETEAAAREEPLRERRWRLLVDGLAASGQRAEAVRAYQRARAALAEVGLEPGPDLRAAERRALAAGAGGQNPSTGPAHARRVPRPRTRLIGREDECRRVADRLEAHRVVTLTGPAGVGKTRVATEVVARRSGDGVVGPGHETTLFVDLTVARDGATVLAVVGDAVGAAPDPTTDALTEVSAAIGRARLLVVIDSCEEAIEDVAEITSRLVDDCPHLRVLATSREPLGLPGEALVAIEPLATTAPEESEGSPARPPEAVELLLDRILLVDPGFEPIGDDHALLRSLCVRLDGLPLAIELAATLVPTLGLRDLSRRLDDRLPLLRADRRGVDRRGTSLEGALQASWDTLDPKLRAVLDALSVFRGSFGIEAVRRVTGSEAGDPHVVHALTDLVRRSLVVVERHEPEPRFRLLESVRAFASVDLGATGSPQDTARRHTEWVLDLAGEAAAGLQGPDQARWLDRLEADRHDLFAAFEQCRRTPDDAARALSAATALFPFWLARGRHREDGIRWCVELAEAATGATPLERVVALMTATMIINNVEPRRGAPITALAAELAGDDPQAQAVAELAHGYYVLAGADGSEVVDSLGRLLPRLPDGPAWWLGRFAGLYALAVAGEWARAYDLGRQATAELRPADEHLAVGFLGRYVDFGIAAGDGRTLADAHECLEVARRYACPSCEASALLDLALLGQEVGGQHPPDLLRDAAGMSHAIGEIPLVLTCGSVLVREQAVQGHHDLALRIAGGLERSLDRIGYSNPWPACRQRFDEGIALARRALGPVASDRARARGTALSYTELVELITTRPDVAHRV